MLLSRHASFSFGGVESHCFQHIQPPDENSFNLGCPALPSGYRSAWRPQAQLFCPAVDLHGLHILLLAELIFRGPASAGNQRNVSVSTIEISEMRDLILGHRTGSLARTALLECCHACHLTTSTPSAAEVHSHAEDVSCWPCFFRRSALASNFSDACRSGSSGFSFTFSMPTTSSSSVVASST